MSSTILSKIYELDYTDEKSLRLAFDDIINETSFDDYESLNSIVRALIDVNFTYVQVIDHVFFVNIQAAFIKIIEHSVDHCELLCHIGRLFFQMVNKVTDESVQLVKQFFVNSNLIACLIQTLSHMLPTSEAYLIASIDYMVDTYQWFQEDHIAIQNDANLLALMTPIAELVKSEQYKNSFLQLSNRQNKLGYFEKFIIITCSKYIVSNWSQRHNEIVSELAPTLLDDAPSIFEHFLPSMNEWNEPLVWCIFSLISLCQCCANQRLLPLYNKQHKRILECVLEIVQSEELWQIANSNQTQNGLQKRTSQLFCYATLYIYTMTFLPELRDKLKESNTVPTLIKLSEANFDKTKFHAYRALAAILTDDDIKQLANPKQIMTVFIVYLKKSFGGLGSGQRLENLLLSLKILVQHDQIKEQFVKQADGLSLVIRCATEPEFEGTKIQTRALKIIMSLTFNDEAEMLIKKNDAFIQHLKTLNASSKPPDVQKVASAILWRLFPTTEKSESNFQYDAMISYAHKDKEICHKIHRALTADKFRIWIDLERMHGTIMQAMADAIEHSRCVIICMSDSYLISPYCQAEAQYAFERQRCLIPLRVQAGYKPQGWLGILISGRIYVDFMKTSFDNAYTQLLVELRQNKSSSKYISALVTHSKGTETPIQSYDKIVYSYPQDVFRWTPENVRSFLLDKNLNQMVPICEQMDGRKLAELHKLCCANSPVMLQTLRSESRELHDSILSTNVFLTFLEEMKKLIPDETSNNSEQKSQTCLLL